MENETITADRDAVAEEIRRFFSQAKREQYQKAYRPNPKFNRPEMWQVAADLCIAAGADPYSFVRAAFLYNTVSGGPFPNQIGTNAAVRWYQNYRKLYGIDNHSQQDVYENEVRSLIQTSFRMAHMQQRLRLRDYLLDDTLRLDVIPAFVRILLLPGNSLLVEKWGRSAYQELMGNPRLMVVLEKMGYKLDFLKTLER